MTSQNVPETNAMGRLLAHENSLSDLFALLVDLDPKPIGQLFNIEGSEFEAIREYTISGGRRMDVVIKDTESDAPRVVIEIKGAAELDQSQLERYGTWTHGGNEYTKFVFSSFDVEDLGTNSEWTAVSLKDLIAPWVCSPHPAAAWLAKEMVDTLELWNVEADRPMGRRTGGYVADIFTRRMSRDIVNVLASTDDADIRVFDSSPHRTNGGQPMLFSWTAHPRNLDDLSVALCVDIRCDGRRDFKRPWVLRPGVEVDVLNNEDPLGPRDLRESRCLAFDLAWAIRDQLSVESIQELLRREGVDSAADALSANKHGGFNRDPSSFDHEAWRGRLERGQHTNSGRFFFQDRGLRLASSLRLNLDDLNRGDLVRATTTILRGLVSGARDSGVVDCSSPAP